MSKLVSIFVVFAVLMCSPVMGYARKHPPPCNRPDCNVSALNRKVDSNQSSTKARLIGLDGRVNSLDKVDKGELKRLDEHDANLKTYSIKVDEIDKQQQSMNVTEAKLAARIQKLEARIAKLEAREKNQSSPAKPKHK